MLGLTIPDFAEFHAQWGLPLRVLNPTLKDQTTMKKLFSASMTALAMTMIISGAHAQTPTYGSDEIAKTEARVTQIKPIVNQTQFRAAVIGPGTMSLKGSKLALDKATDPKVKDFASFETDEQSALSMILKELHTAAPKMTDNDKKTEAMLDGAAKGSDFDKAYIQSQIDGHEVLLMFVESYLKNANLNSKDPKEIEARHLAYFMKSAIKQHISNTTEILANLK